MKNLTVTLDESLLLAAKKAAAAQGVSLNRYVRELLQRSLKPRPNTEDDPFFRLVAELKPSSGGWRWNRDELYEDAG